MTSKDRDEIKETISNALSESILGRVEQNLMNILSPKVARMQTLQAEAERATEKAKADEAESIKRKKLLEDHFPALQSKLAEERAKFDVEMAAMQKSKDAFKTRLNDLNQEVKQAEITAGNKVRAAHATSDKLIAEIETNIAAEKAAFEREKKAHEDFRKSIGLDG